MKDFLHRDSLEDFISEQADKHRMYPSDKLWKNVRRQVHKPKKWPALPAITMFVISSLVVLTVVTKPQHDVLNGSVRIAYNSNAPKNNIAGVGETGNHQNNITTATLTNSLIQDRLLINQITEKTIAAAEEKIKISRAIASRLYMFEDNYITAPSGSDGSAAINIAAVNTEKKQEIVDGLAKFNVPETAGSNAIQSPLLTESNFTPYLFDIQSRLKNILNIPETREAGGVAFFTLPRYNNSLKDMYDFDFKASELDIKSSPLEKLSKASSRFDFRFYLTPSVSYRRLKKSDKATENGATGSAFLPFESNYRIKPSQAADHHPALGYETGFGLGYQLTNKLKLTGGFQFNISRYRIDAYLYKEEPAALMLTQGSITSTVNTTSSLRSTAAGNKPITLRNRYYQLSLPVGIDYTLVNRKRLTWGVATSIQPTYTFDKQPLIFSSNYKNYTDGSVYVRNFNVNAAAETYLGYKTGSYTWQLGPQVRYQLLPSLENKYPNKEYLINYGLKVGVVKSLK